MHPSFATAHLLDETTCVETLLSALKWDEDRSRRVGLQAEVFLRRMRDQKAGLSEIESFLETYPLSSPEGLALMTLAEALLRVPDAATADALIAEKMGAGNWQASGSGLMKLAGLGMGLAQKTLGSFLGDLGRPVIRKSMEEAIRRIGQQFVVGETIEKATRAAQKLEKQGNRLSYDMLGEGARTAEDAARYFQSYQTAAEVIGKAGAAGLSLQARPGMSVKLSALHPRYSWTQRERCVPEMVEKLAFLCSLAVKNNISLTVDAEEADRLELAWDIISTVAVMPELQGWDGFGFAIQAYDKRCFSLIDEIGPLAARAGRQLQVRLVKGAYWDTEIKRAQVAALPDYPVFTRKTNTDLSYLACAQKLLSLRGGIWPMFATHNAHTVAAIIEMAGENRQGFEFQRLHGMGISLHDQILADKLAPVTIYAPVGSYEDLLAYLVRRMLENGANTSFIAKARGGAATSEVIADPVHKARSNENKRQPRLPLPDDIFRPERSNSAGVDLSHSPTRDQFFAAIPPSHHWRTLAVTPIINGQFPIKSGAKHVPVAPGSAGEVVAEVWDTTADRIDEAFTVARKGYHDWSKAPASQRAAVLNKLADLLERDMERLIGLLQFEGGKTIYDAIGEVREAVDFCRYYAAEGLKLFTAKGVYLPGPTGEENRLVLDGRGVFVCISPWNFPLAIFLGQIAAALMAGNSVIAKPAEQTPAIAFETVKLLLEAGLPPAVITLLPGDGRIGAALVDHAGVDGVAFTGSTDVARLINRALAAKDAAIVPLIAETGGQNAMIVDTTALPEQVIDDVILSAFGSAGQRCSALRVLYLQNEIADKVIALLRGALAELKVGDPRDPATDIGPVIDAAALQGLNQHLNRLKEFGTLLGQAPLNDQAAGWFIAPCAYEIDGIKRLPQEVFGPILHVIRYAAKDRDQIIEDINAAGYGLTFGLHSRLQTRAAEIADRVAVGNVYINRSIIGAVVGVQPFGGRGLSGTGPKAGGPYYLHRFATEKTISINTTATGGNIALLASVED